MFLYLSVILFTGGGVYPSMQWAGNVYPSMQWGGGVCLWVGGCLPFGLGVYKSMMDQWWTPLGQTPMGRHPLPWADTLSLAVVGALTNQKLTAEGHHRSLLQKVTTKAYCGRSLQKLTAEGHHGSSL